MLVEMMFLVGGVVAFLLLLSTGWLIGIYNTFVTARQDLREQWSNIKTEYQRRADLILNLVETSKGSMKFERDTLTEVTRARGGYFGDSKKDEMKNLGKLNTLFANLMGRLEAYPKLASIGTLHVVLEELKTTENRINIARTDYNETVRDYHVLIHSFPAFFVAKPFGFLDEEYFEDQEGASVAPKINMGDFHLGTPEKITKKAKKKR